MAQRRRPPPFPARRARRSAPWSQPQEVGDPERPVGERSLLDPLPPGLVGEAIRPGMPELVVGVHPSGGHLEPAGAVGNDHVDRVEVGGAHPPPRPRGPSIRPGSRARESSRPPTPPPIWPRNSLSSAEIGFPASSLV